MSDQYESLRDVGLTVGTPMYGGQCFGEYTLSLTGLATICGRNGIKLSASYLYNESFISRARNFIANDFLEYECEHLLFWDADVGIDPKNILTLMQIQRSNPKIDIIGAAYPLKNVNWHNVQKAVLAGVPVAELEYHASRFPCSKPDFDAAGSELIVKVDKLATGMMMISRSALKRYAQFYPEDTYTFDGTLTKCLFRKNLSDDEIIEAMSTSKRTAFFKGGLDKETGEFLGEDYLFCKMASEAGLNIFLCPWMQLSHTGNNVFRGSVLNNWNNNLAI